MRRNNFPDIPFCSNLKMRPACQTLSNAFDMSRKTPQTSYLSSSDACIPWVIDKSWLIQESPGLKPDWFVEIRWFVMKKLNISLYKRRSNIFPQIGRSEIGSDIVCHFFMNWNNIYFFPC